MDDAINPTAPRAPNTLWLIVLGALVAMLLTAAVRVCPPFEGDAYEYGEIALHWVSHGTLTERHLRNFNVPDLKPTHAAAQRANYYTVLVAPFAAVLRDSPWTIFLPGLLGFLFAAWAAHRAGMRLFDARAAWWAALLVLLHPRFIYLTVQDPTPALWLAGLCLCSAWLFHDKKYIPAGALLGVAVFVKQSAAALLPAYFLYVLLFDRAELKKAKLWLGLGACLVFMAPFLIRNAVLFGSPFYTEEAAARQNFDPQTLRNGNLLQTTFALRDPAPADSGKQPFFLWKTLQLFDVNVKDVLLGANYIDYGPGFVSLIYFAAVPFFFLGLWFGRGHAGVRLCALIIFFFLLLVMLVVVPYESRYIFPVVPFGILISIFGIYETGRRIAWMRPRVILLFVLLTGSLLTLPFLALHMMQNRTASMEYIAAAKFLRQASPESATIMAWPPFASAFYADRETVPLPYGGLEQIHKGITRYGADYVLFSDLIDEGEPPAVDFLEPLAKGRTITLYKVDPDAPGFKNFEQNYGVIRTSFDPLFSIYKLLQRIPLRLDWYWEEYARRYPGGWAAAFCFFILLGAGFTRLAAAHKYGIIGSVFLLCCVLATVFVVYVQIIIGAPQSAMQPRRAPVNPAQLRAAVSGGTHTLLVTGDEECGTAPCTFGQGYKTVLQLKSFEENPEPLIRQFAPQTEYAPERTAWVVLVNERGILDSPAAVAAWPLVGIKAHKRALPTLEQARRAGLIAVRIGGGYVLRPAQDFGVSAAPGARPAPFVYTARRAQVE